MPRAGRQVQRSSVSTRGSLDAILFVVAEQRASTSEVALEDFKGDRDSLRVIWPGSRSVQTAAEFAPDSKCSLVGRPDVGGDRRCRGTLPIKLDRRGEEQRFDPGQSGNIRGRTVRLP